MITEMNVVYYGAGLLSGFFLGFFGFLIVGVKSK